MKRNFFNPAMSRFVNPITGKESRSNRSRFGAGCYKTDAGDDDDEEEKKKLLARIKEQNNTQFREMGLTAEQIKQNNSVTEAWGKFPVEALRALTDDKTGAISLINDLKARLETLETEGKPKKDKVLSVREQLMKYKEDNKDIIAQIRAGKQVGLPALEIDLRAATSPMTPANTLNGVIPGLYDMPWNLNDIPRNNLTFWDYITKGRTGKPVLPWVNKTNPQGAAGFIAPGELKPLVSFEIEMFYETAKKVAAADKVALELLEDIDQFESWIKDELRYQVRLALNTAAMTADGSDPDGITGIQSLSVAFTQTGLSTDNPTIADAIRAVVAQMRTGNLSGDITVFINPIDAANMDMAKASTSGVYMLAPFSTANGKTIAGATVVEDQNIPVGYFQAAYLQYYKILIYKDMYITFGWENDDFRKNLLTYLCETRLIQAFNEQYTGAFVYDSFENVRAAIAA